MQGSNPGLPHCRRILYQLSHKGSPVKGINLANKKHLFLYLFIHSLNTLFGNVYNNIRGLLGGSVIKNPPAMQGM